MADYKVEPETGKREMKGGKISARLKRGKESNDFFAIVYGIFLTLLVGIVSEIPGDSTPWIVKILFIPLAAIILFYCFSFNAVRNLLIRIYSYIKDYEERY